MERIGVWLAKRLLSKQKLSFDARNQLIIHILDSVNAVPLSDIITTGPEGEILTLGRPLTLDEARDLRESARMALGNRALKLIREQVKYVAFVLGAIKAQKPDDLLFARAALWWVQEVERQLITLTGREQELPL